jgi:hypothetical protein
MQTKETGLVKAGPGATPERPSEAKLSHREKQGGIVRFAAKSLKVTGQLAPAAILGLEVPTGMPRILFAVTAGETQLTGNLSAKGLRRVKARIVELGVENVVVLLQARLATKSRLDEVGVSAQPKSRLQSAAATGS